MFKKLLTNWCQQKYSRIVFNVTERKNTEKHFCKMCLPWNRAAPGGFTYAVTPALHTRHASLWLRKDDVSEDQYFRRQVKAENIAHFYLMTEEQSLFRLCGYIYCGERRDSSVGIAAGYGIRGRGSNPSKEKVFNFLYSIQTSSWPTQLPIKLISGLFPRE
jgi:hypothetical protein